MSPPCRCAAALTSGYHPEPDPDRSLPGGPDLRAMAGLSALRSEAVRPWRPGFKGRVSVMEVLGVAAAPGGLKASRCRLSARTEEGVTLLSGHFARRADELGSLERILDELDRGCPGAIEVAGEPGIGKTRLLRELAARAGARGHLVLSGAASEFENDLPFSVFVDALDEHVAGLEPDRLAVLDDAVQAELAHVLPSLSALAAGREVASQHERYRSHRAVRALLENLAQALPLVLILDDVHWADSASAELLGALLRRPPAAAVLTAVALRPRQLPERLSVAL